MVHLAYGSHFLQKASVTLHTNARPYGCTSDRLWISPNLGLSVLSLTESMRSTWLASDCNRC